jgi:hypothetical protein
MAAYFAWTRLPYGDLPHLLARVGGAIVLAAFWRCAVSPEGPSGSGVQDQLTDLRLTLLNRQYRAD